MATTDDALNKKRELLKIKRDLLFKEFIDRPSDCRFAVEINALDDEIAECARKIEQMGRVS